MISLWMILTAMALLSLSGLPGCLLPARSPAGQRVAAALMLAGGIVGVCGVAVSLGATTSPAWHIPWVLPWGQFAVTIDPISALFLGPVFAVPALGSLYGLGYWKQAEHPENGRRLGLFYGLLAGAMAMVAIARDGVLFLIAWEIMAVAAYFAATVEEDNPEVRRAGRVYLIVAHLGTLCLIALFALWHRATGSFALEPAPAMPAELAGALFVLAVIGFGFKAGLMPLHIWLPGAHANAPSHVSAVMSGVMLKMGVYGIVRLTALLPTPALWWGGVLLGVGAITGVAGIVCAIGQHDLKRLLAYSSIENIGIIAMGLGLALLGRSLGRPDWVLLGLGGALLHVWNHSLFKPLLFFNAGAIIHAAHTRNMDRLGGLARRMPRATVLFAVGAVAICALPPLNGFASEWLLYVGFLRALVLGGDPGSPAVAAAAVVLALIGALALACFVKLLGTVFLGAPRSDAAHRAHDLQASMYLPMAVLATGCVFIGLFPGLTAPMLERAARAWWEVPDPAALPIEAIAPLRWITALGLGLVALAGAIILALKMLPRAKVAAAAGTWDCGYARPTARMQYTGSSLGQTLVDLFAFALRPKNHWPAIRGSFPRGAHFKSLVPDTILDRLVVPLFRLAGRYLPWVRMLQQGQTQLYMLYILVIMIVLLLWGAMGVQS